MDKYIKYKDIRKCRFFQDERGEWILHADIIKIPAANVAPIIHGKWHDVYMTSPSSFAATCSVCGISNDIPHPISAHYCPNCGARMDKGGDRE